VIGRDAAAFHPKLWLFRSAESLTVLSGSGNLTHGGLVDNNEQFEIVRVELNSDEAAAHEERLDRLTANAIPLDDVEGSTLWLEWESVIKRQRRYREAIRRLEASLADRPFVGRRDDDKRRLIENLQEPYDLTVDAKLPRRDGQRYIPHRFREGIERARAGADPVLLVTRMCRRQTEGSTSFSTPTVPT
jgi:hypothetical protein